MGFFGWLLIFFLSVWLIFRFFGKYIVKYFLSTILKQVAKDMERQQRAYQQSYGSDPFHDTVHVDEDLKVSKPKHDETRKITPDQIAEDVEFEEVN